MYINSSYLKVNWRRGQKCYNPLEDKEMIDNYQLNNLYQNIHPSIINIKKNKYLLSDIIAFNKGGDII